MSPVTASILTTTPSVGPEVTATVDKSRVPSLSESLVATSRILSTEFSLTEY